MECLDIITAANAPAVDEHVGNSTATCGLLELSLDGGTERVQVKLDDVRGRDDGVVLKQDAFGLCGEAAVRLGEDDD